MTQLIILGAGGLALEAKWILESRGGHSFDGELLELVAFVVDDVGGADALEGVAVHDMQRALSSYKPAETRFHCAIGNNAARERIAELFLEQGFAAVSVAHSSAIVAPSAEVGAGCYLGAFVVIGPMAKVAGHVVMNSHAAIGHHARLDAFSQVCPGAKVSGECELGRRSLVGSNATMLPGTRLAADSVVGANSLMLRSTKPGDSIIGVPATAAFKSRRPDRESP